MSALVSKDTVSRVQSLSPPCVVLRAQRVSQLNWGNSQGKYRAEQSRARGRGVLEETRAVLHFDLTNKGWSCHHSIFFFFLSVPYYSRFWKCMCVCYT